MDNLHNSDNCNCKDKSATYCIDLDLLPPECSIEIRRRVPIRTILFFITHLNKLDYHRRVKWIRWIHERTGTPHSKGLILILKRRLNGSRQDYHIDKYWDNLISELLHRELHLETEMWRLSTIGGAVSAMGFFNSQFVKYAMKVSLRQLEIAKMLGDAVLVARCFLYIALSLAQKRNFGISARIVRCVFDEANRLQSHLLKNCAQGIWTTLKWMKGNVRSCR